MIQSDIVPDYVFRIILVGDSSCGKSSFLNRFCFDEFDSKIPSTIGVDFKAKILRIRDNKVVKFQIWDTAGQENFYSICRSYYRHTAACLLLYDITNQSSFGNIGTWVKRLKDNNDNFSTKKGIIFLVGNKIDLEDNRVISFEQGLNFAHTNKLLFSEVSCKTGNSVYSTGERLANEIYTKVKDGSISLNDRSSGAKIMSISSYLRIDNRADKDNTKHSCC